MKLLKKIIFFSILYFSSNSISLSDTHNLQEILELIQSDIKTLEKAVYSENFKSKSENENFSNQPETEDALTRHLLKLSEIEGQFQNLTNNFEEINFKLDKLSTRLSKIQADNQLRFQQIEKNINKNISLEVEKSTQNSNIDNDIQILPGSTEPQDLGSVSYKDMASKTEIQRHSRLKLLVLLLQKISLPKKKFCLMNHLKNNMSLQLAFLKLEIIIRLKELLENLLRQTLNTL